MPLFFVALIGVLVLGGVAVGLLGAVLGEAGPLPRGIPSFSGAEKEGTEKKI